MRKKAIIIISLVPEANSKSKEKIKNEIKESLNCSWLAEVEKVTVE